MHSATSATRIADGDLDVRLPENGDGEIAQLTRAVNTMADALAARLEAEREVTANIAHELRTPLPAWSAPPASSPPASPRTWSKNAPAVSEI
jgi:methyl-accepting chemotaxis protein